MKDVDFGRGVWRSLGEMMIPKVGCIARTAYREIPQQQQEKTNKYARICSQASSKSTNVINFSLFILTILATVSSDLDPALEWPEGARTASSSFSSISHHHRKSTSIRRIFLVITD